MRVALKFLTYGVLVGVLFAPRSGAETRRSVMSWVKSTAGGLTSGMGGSHSGMS
jgi:hypothetical protein